MVTICSLFYASLLCYNLSALGRTVGGGVTLWNGPSVHLVIWISITSLCSNLYLYLYSDQQVVSCNPEACIPVFELSYLRKALEVSSMVLIGAASCMMPVSMPHTDWRAGGVSKYVKY